jgi:peptide deformylase
MAILEIIKYPDARLKEVSAAVEAFDSELRSFVAALIDTMRASPGVGLAAPQVGRLIRVIAVDVTPKNPGHGLIVLINPELTSSSGSKVGREGCLSVPEYTANITRATEITLKGRGPDGEEVTIESSGFEAIALQHELDHLNGILFIDRIASMKRDLFKRKI